AQRWLRQRLVCWSGLWSGANEASEASAAARIEGWGGGAGRVAPYPTPGGVYFIIFATRDADAPPAIDMQLSLFTDAGQGVLKRAEANAAEVLRLDGLLKQRDASLDRQTEHVHHLEKLVAERERIVEERDRQLAVLGQARDERDRVIADRDRQLAELRSGRER